MTVQIATTAKATERSMRQVVFCFMVNLLRLVRSRSIHSGSFAASYGVKSSTMSRLLKSGRVDLPTPSERLVLRQFGFETSVFGSVGGDLTASLWRQLISLETMLSHKDRSVDCPRGACESAQGSIIEAFREDASAYETRVERGLDRLTHRLRFLSRDEQLPALVSEDNRGTLTLLCYSMGYLFMEAGLLRMAADLFEVALDEGSFEECGGEELQAKCYTNLVLALGHLGDYRRMNAYEGGSSTYMLTDRQDNLIDLAQAQAFVHRMMLPGFRLRMECAHELYSRLDEAQLAHESTSPGDEIDDPETEVRRLSLLGVLGALTGASERDAMRSLFQARSGLGRITDGTCLAQTRLHLEVDRLRLISLAYANERVTCVLDASEVHEDDDREVRRLAERFMEVPSTSAIRAMSREVTACSAFDHSDEARIASEEAQRLIFKLND